MYNKAPCGQVVNDNYGTCSHRLCLTELKKVYFVSLHIWLFVVEALFSYFLILIPFFLKCLWIGLWNSRLLHNAALDGSLSAFFGSLSITSKRFGSSDMLHVVFFGKFSCRLDSLNLHWRFLAGASWCRLVGVKSLSTLRQTRKSSPFWGIGELSWAAWLMSDCLFIVTYVPSSSRYCKRSLSSPSKNLPTTLDTMFDNSYNVIEDSSSLVTTVALHLS